MLDIMSQARDSINAYNAALTIHSANIANMSVPGYKRLDVSFQTVFERVQKQGTAASTFANLGGTNPQQLGQGTAVSNVKVDFTSGAYAESQAINLGINGSGLFIVSPDGGASYLYSRSGKFSMINGNLINDTGMQVYGLYSSGSLVPITGLPGSETDYSWSSSGELFYQGSTSGFRIALTSFSNPGGLQQAQGTSFAETMASGPAATPMASGGTYGAVLPGQLEQSNVFYLGESIDSLEVQRAINANLSVVKMASDLISSFISKLG